MSLGKIETTLDEALNKRAPVKLPENGRKALADILWVVALVVGVLQLFFTYWLWQAGHPVDTRVDYANELSLAYGASSIARSHLGPFYYLSVLSMGVVAVLLLLASPGLKNMKKNGWDMLFYALLVQAATAVLLLFAGDYGGFGDFLGAAIGALIGAYLLFQVRDYFTGVTRTAAAVHHNGHHQPKPLDDEK